VSKKQEEWLCPRCFINWVDRPDDVCSRCLGDHHPEDTYLRHPASGPFAVVSRPAGKEAVWRDMASDPHWERQKQYTHSEAIELADARREPA
jgi:hypothetical protein